MQTEVNYITDPLINDPYVRITFNNGRGHSVNIQKNANGLYEISQEDLKRIVVVCFNEGSYAGKSEFSNQLREIVEYSKED
jgi:hypothetical protein